MKHALPEKGSRDKAPENDATFRDDAGNFPRHSLSSFFILYFSAQRFLNSIPRRSKPKWRKVLAYRASNEIEFSCAKLIHR